MWLKCNKEDDWSVIKKMRNTDDRILGFKALIPIIGCCEKNKNVYRNVKLY